MTETPQFRVVLRGYEPAQVDKRLEELAQQAEEARRQAAQLADRVQQLEHEQQSGGTDGAEPQPVVATFEHLGQRVAKILSLAEAEAKDLLDKGRAALEAERSSVADEVSRQRSEADKHAE